MLAAIYAFFSNRSHARRGKKQIFQDEWFKFPDEITNFAIVFKIA